MEATKPLISVIVPVYDVEPYLRRCVDSILAQTYENLEVILVDDGSPDRCGEICDEYAEQDKRVKVYHKQNGGVSDARNFGTERASGVYIAYIDSDDYVAEDYFTYLLALLEDNRADISMCSFVETDNYGADFTQTDGTEDVVILSGREACRTAYGRGHFYYRTPWGKLLSREIVVKFKYPKGRRHEDEATVVKYYYEAKRVAIGNRCLYAYYQNDSGFMKSLGDEKMRISSGHLHTQQHFLRKRGKAGYLRYAGSVILRIA